MAIEQKEQDDLGELYNENDPRNLGAMGQLALTQAQTRAGYIKGLVNANGPDTIGRPGAEVTRAKFYHVFGWEEI